MVVLPHKITHNFNTYKGGYSVCNVWATYKEEKILCALTSIIGHGRMKYQNIVDVNTGRFMHLEACLIKVKSKNYTFTFA